METVLKILPPNISDHALLYLDTKEQRKTAKHFKFNNYLTELPGYDALIKRNWDVYMRGSPMYVLWQKFKRLQHELKTFSKPFSDVKNKLTAARDNLKNLQKQLIRDKMNTTVIGNAINLTEEVVALNKIEWKILQQREKIDWIRKGDGNNHYLYVAVKTKHHSNCLTNLRKSDDRKLSDQNDIEEEVMEFYKNLMGKEDNNINHIDIEAMRMEKQLNMEQREYLTRNIIEDDIIKALRGIGDLKAPGLDGYGAKFFKAS
ncbi:unnamed protein product [Lathyrus sativus]|nr:unnamed protein product [Lathyrus sativus]